MAYDEGLAQRVREALQDEKPVEKRMFGGLAFMIGGNMGVGINAGDLMVRVGPERYEVALAEEHAREMDFTGKPLRGYVYVDGDIDDDVLERWVGLGVAFARTLPPK